MTVLILSGLPGSGKSTAAQFFKKHGIDVIRMGDATDEVLAKKRLPRTEQNEQVVRNALRSRQGDAAYAAFAISKIGSKGKRIVVIEGIRSLPEWKYFTKELSNVYLVWIESDTKVRYDRLKRRKQRKLSKEEIRNRDAWEIQTMDIYSLKKQADYCIVNNTTKKEFYKKLEQRMHIPN